MRDAMVRRHLVERARVVDRQGDVAATSGGFLAVTKFLRLLFQSLALALGAWLAIRQSISAGAIFAASLLIGRALQTRGADTGSVEGGAGGTGGLSPAVLLPRQP
jgi:ATP-binding cassette subfamily C protein